jgi:hypothetical protein
LSATARGQSRQLALSGSVVDAATGDRVYLNTAAVGLASRRVADAYHEDDVDRLVTTLASLTGRHDR